MTDPAAKSPPESGPALPAGRDQRRLDDYVDQLEDIFANIQGMLACRDLDSLERKAADVHRFLLKMAVSALGAVAGDLRERNAVDEALPRRAVFFERRGHAGEAVDTAAAELTGHDPLGEEGKEPWASLMDRLEETGFQPLQLEPRSWMPRRFLEGDLALPVERILAQVGSVAVIPILLRDHRDENRGRVDRERVYGLEFLYLKERTGGGDDRIAAGLRRLRTVAEVVLTNRVGMEGLLKKVATFRHQAKGKSLELQGSSLSIQALRQKTEEAARMGATRLRMEGPVGAGKKHVAELFHRLGPGAGNPFVAIDCARVAMGRDSRSPSDYAFRKRLFGDAHAEDLEEAMGAIEQARGGTLFLDEVEHLPLSFQYKLAQVLAEGRFSRLGEDGHVKVDCAIILASEVDLDEEAAERRFSSKLLRPFRRGPRLKVPGLNGRREDIPALVESFFALQVRSQKRHRLRRVHPETMRLMVERDWSDGNVKAVQNLVAWAVARTSPEDVELTPEHLPGAVRPADPGAVLLRGDGTPKPFRELFRDQLARLEHLLGSRSRALEAWGVGESEVAAWLP